MADKHPYVGGTGALTQVLDHLRKSFPAKLDSEVLKKLGFAPKNESYIINIVRFLKLIDEKGARTEMAQKTFTFHEDSAFQKAFSEVVKNAYSELFSLHGDSAWALDNSKLVTFFRQTDQSSDIVGTRQAGTFRVLAAYAGYGEPISTKSRTGKPRDAAPSVEGARTKKAKGSNKPPPFSAPTTSKTASGIGLTVRIEINLPATGDKDTYDKIFKSIRENLLNG